MAQTTSLLFGKPIAEEAVRHQAPREALRIGHTQRIGTEHVLIALTRAEGGFTARLLAHIGQEPARLRLALRLLARPGEGPEFTGRMSLTPRLREALMKRQQERGEAPLDERDLLLAILRGGPGVAVRTLERLGWHATELADFVAADAGSEAATLRADKPPPHGALDLEQIGRDLVAAARAGELPIVTGRGAEQVRITQALLAQEPRVALLSGAAGSGKTSIIQGFAARLADADRPLHPRLQGKRIILLDTGAILAGAEGDPAETLRGALAAAAADPDIILAIDDLHQYFGGPLAGAARDVGAVLAAAIRAGRVALIAVTTPAEFARITANDPSLARRFEVIAVAPLTAEATLEALRATNATRADYYDLTIEDGALVTAVSLAERYLKDQALPASAFRLIDRACTRVAYSRMTQRGTTARPAGKTVTASAVLAAMAEFAGVAPADLGSDLQDRLLLLEDALTRRVAGQTDALARVARAVVRGWSRFRDAQRPRAILLLGGPSGVGKTQTAKTLAEALFGDRRDDRFLLIDMSDFAEPHRASQLVGAPPGYVGADREGRLTGWLRQHPEGIVLFDEIEKAHPQAQQILLDLFAEGQIIDSQNRLIGARDAVFILTSNLFPDPRDLAEDDPARRDGLFRAALGRALLPELVNRFDDVIRYRALDHEGLADVVQQHHDRLQDELDAISVRLDITPEARDWLIEQAIINGGGARAVARLVDTYLANPIANLQLRRQLLPGMILVARLSGDGLSVAIEGTAHG